MKNLILLQLNGILIFLFSSFLLSAQYVSKTEIEGPRVPTVVTKSFEKNYPDAKVGQWYKVGATTYEVYIKHEKSKKLIIFDWQGRVGEELVEVKKKTLTDTQKEKLFSKYKDLKIKSVFKNPTNNKMVVEGENRGELVQITV